MASLLKGKGKEKESEVEMLRAEVEMLKNVIGNLNKSYYASNFSQNLMVHSGEPGFPKVCFFFVAPEWTIKVELISLLSMEFPLPMPRLSSETTIICKSKTI